jgi:hypothetical protein
MSLKHGRTRYARGCRCDICKAAERDYQRNRYRRQRGLPVDPPEGPPLIVASADGQGGAGPVESAVQAELHSLHTVTDRPGVAQIALALARILDSPKAVSSQPAAAKVLAALLDTLRSASAHGRRGGLAMVRTMTEKGGTWQSAPPSE